MSVAIDHQAALLQLLERTRLPKVEVASRFEQARDRTYWEKLNPGLSIGHDYFGQDIETVAADTLASSALQSALNTHGYFAIDSLLARPLVERLTAAMETVRSAGWPAIFSFVYDQFWSICRVPSLVKLLSSTLGPQYKQTSQVWAHYVYPKRRAAGWPPHVDSPGQRNRVTIWIALNDATLDNGCLYLLPKDLAPIQITENFVTLDSVSKTDFTAVLQGVRALPVRAGTVLGWGPEVIHWSSCNEAGTHPRISISQEFLAEATSPIREDLPLLDPRQSLPTFDQRLHAIGAGIVNYVRIETSLIRYLELAHRLLSGVSPK